MSLDHLYNALFTGVVERIELIIQEVTREHMRGDSPYDFSGYKRLFEKGAYPQRYNWVRSFYGKCRELIHKYFDDLYDYLRVIHAPAGKVAEAKAAAETKEVPKATRHRLDFYVHAVNTIVHTGDIYGRKEAPENDNMGLGGGSRLRRKTKSRKNKSKKRR